LFGKNLNNINDKISLFKEGVKNYE
jgi:hypothetical protein